MNTLSALLFILAGLEIVVLAHLLGHLLVAAALRLPVEFHLGFGPALPGCRRRWGRHTYVLAVFPLGGFVRAAPLPQPDAEPLAPDVSMPRYGPLWKRLIVATGGVLGNVLLAWICFAVWAGRGMERVAAVVGRVEPGAPAWVKGVPAGAAIVRIGDVADPYFDDLLRAVYASRPGEELSLAYRRPGQVAGPTAIRLEPRRRPQDLRPMIGVLPAPRAELIRREVATASVFPREVVADLTAPVFPGSAAAAARPPFEFGDVILGTTDTDDTGVVHPLPPDWWQPNSGRRDYFELDRRLKNLAGKEMTVRVRRASGGTADLKVPPAFFRTLGVRMAMGPCTAVRDGSPAQKAGLQTTAEHKQIRGDLIVRVEVKDPDNGKPISFAGAQLDPLRLPAQLRQWAGRVWHKNPFPEPAERTVSLELLRHQPPRPGIMRELEPIRVQLDWEPKRRLEPGEPGTPDSPLAIPELGLAYQVLTRVAAPEAPDSPLQPGDEITALALPGPRIGTSAVQSVGPEQFAWAFDRLQEVPDDVVIVRFRRGEGEWEFDAPLRVDMSWPRADRGLLLETDTRIQQAESVGEAVSLGLAKVGQTFTETLQTLRGMLTGRISTRNVAGPVAVGNTARTALAVDSSVLLALLALLSLNFALLNVLPVPVLDGGEVWLLGYEKLRGRPVGAVARYVVCAVGLGLLGLLLSLPGVFAAL
jgi:membrane-associated protease RseP (regulator of RpoE activity)